MPDVLRTDVLAKFSCLGDKCPDTCCKGWSMQMDDVTLALYRKEAPELLEAVEPSREAPWIMRKDATGTCVKFEGGLCGIHKSYGDPFLGDACHFYPRVTRSLGGRTLMTATLSCPEVARLAFESEAPCAQMPASVDRLPHTVKDYLPEGFSPDEALAVHQAFINAAGDSSASAERNFLRIASASRSLELVARDSWARAASFYLANADKRLPAAEQDPSDPFNLLHALCGLVVASKKRPSERLQETISEMEKALAATLDWQNVKITTTPESLPAWEKLQAAWKGIAPLYAPMLRRWLQMQLSVSLYPFSGLGNTLPERITIIGVRMATVKLAILCSCATDAEALPQDVAVRIVQSLSRILDHLGDPAFSLQIYGETGWTQEKRMRGLIEI